MSKIIDLNTENQWKDDITPLSAYNLNVMLNGIIAANKNKSVETDQTYQPTSEKPQSGKAVKQALNGYLPLSGGILKLPDDEGEEESGSYISIDPSGGNGSHATFDTESLAIFDGEGASSRLSGGFLVLDHEGNKIELSHWDEEYEPIPHLKLNDFIITPYDVTGSDVAKASWREWLDVGNNSGNQVSIQLITWEAND